MSHSKEEQSFIPKDSNNNFRLLPNDIVGELADYLSVQDLIKLMKASITTYNLFKPNLNRALALKALVCVVQGDVDGLVLIAQHKPAVLFDKGEVTDPRQRTFYQVSAYQLILFLCDEDMKDQILSKIPEEFTLTCKQQYAEMGSGGTDLIKLDRDPLLVAEEHFKGITEFKINYTLFDNTQHELTFPLLENPDGIIYYQDKKTQEVQFYYANRETKEIKKLSDCVTSEKEQYELEQFKASFDSMENNSGRRSSNAEHQLIAKTLQCTLHRKGILYEQNGILYRDSRTGFNLINRYRTCVRLYEEAEHNGQWDKAHAFWREGVGKAQGEEMWLLQRVCEENRPFYPPPTHFKGFKRGFVFYNFDSENEEFIFNDGKLAAGLGSDFSLYKGRVRVARGSYGCGGADAADLIAVFRLVEDAKANIVTLKQELGSSLQRSSTYTLV